MKNLFVIFLSALSLTAFAQQKKVAVYVTGEDANVNKVLGSKLVHAIGLSGEYSAIERTTSILAELNKEQAYQRSSGEVDDDELSRLGKQFGVQYVCAAIVSRIFNEDYISIRLINVESAQVERTASSNKNIQSYEDLTSTAKTISDELFSSLNHTKQSNSKKVAVYVVKNEASQNIGRVLGDKLVAGFTNSGRYIAVERTNGFLSQIKKEQKYEREGAVDDGEIARIGKQFGVQYVCVAEVSDVYGKKHIDARLVNVETAEIENSFDVGGQISNINDCIQLTNQIVSNLSKGTFKEQQEEARLKAEGEARIRAEREAQAKAELEARKKVEEEKRQRAYERVTKRKEELSKMWEKGYIIIKHKGIKYMVCIEPININSQEVAANRRYSRYGYSDWEISSTENVSITSIAQVAPGSSIIERYINEVSDDASYDFVYIVNEYIYYFNKHILKTDYYWSGPNTQHWYEEKWVNIPSSYLDNNKISRSACLSWKSTDYSHKHDKKAWLKRTALAFLVRRM